VPCMVRKVGRRGRTTRSHWGAIAQGESNVTVSDH
jgi:hypothetical protein